MADRNDEEEARRILERVDRESDMAAPVARMARRARDHFSAAEADPDDRIEIWGTRIGRALALAIVLLILWTFFQYLLRGG
ncbi:MAG: hypothetical protein JNL61_14845 [Rhizobiaceae bacterium]|nr:hypothetical protein [Rhizobiaceae bacterium]